MSTEPFITDQEFADEIKLLMKDPRTTNDAIIKVIRAIRRDTLYWSVNRLKEASIYLK